MTRQPWGLFALALAIGVVGLVALGVDASTLLAAGLVLACPLMMLLMHGGGHGRRAGHDSPGATTEDGQDAGRPPAHGQDPAVRR